MWQAGEVELRIKARSVKDLSRPELAARHREVLQGTDLGSEDTEDFVGS